jgi:hypothetical protein
MNLVLVQRQAALAGVALLGTLGALALTRTGDGGAPSAGGTSIRPRVAWEEARVSILGPGRLGRETRCGLTLTRETLGIAHPVLPCGVELVLAHGSRRVQVEVVEQGNVGAGVAFELTPALADELRVTGTQVVHWRFAPA